MTITAPDELRRRGLVRMKSLATGLLVVALAIYAATAGRTGALGFVNAGAEAAMVGALADWFAVTALFRRPLGLPIPHTALIPTRKDAIGRSLEDFVATNFLSEPVVRDKLARAQISRRIGGWLAQPSNAERVAGEISTAARGLIGILRDDDVVAVLEQAVIRRAAALPVSPLIGQLLGGLVRDGSHHRLVDLLLDEIERWLVANRDTVIRLVTDQAPAWTPQWVDQRIGRRLYDEAHRWVQEVRGNPDHQARHALDHLLGQLAEDLQHDAATMARTEALKERLLSQPGVLNATLAIWSTVRRLLLEAVDDPDGELRRRVLAGLAELGRRLAADPALQARVDGYLMDAAGYVVRQYAGELATVISDTVQRWDAAEASRRIELQVGRDLQFIRINGTVVGALAGLAIHAATVLLS